jgi:hypothetical protein
MVLTAAAARWTGRGVDITGKSLYFNLVLVILPKFIMVLAEVVK